MLLDEAVSLSPFCMASLRRSLGNKQLQSLCKECGVSWAAAEAALAEAASKAGDGRQKGGQGGRQGGGGSSGGSSGLDDAGEDK